MTSFNTRALGFALTARIVVATVGLVWAGSAQAQAMITLEQAVKDCRLISSKSARLGCYDRAIDSANAPPPRQSMVSARAAPLAASVVPPAPIAPAPMPARAASAAPKVDAPPTIASAMPPAGDPDASAAPPESPAKSDVSDDGDSFEVGSASLNGNNVLSVVTRDGVTWTQADGTEIAHLPKVGDTMLVTKNVFGKATCHVGTTAFTCKAKK